MAELFAEDLAMLRRIGRDGLAACALAGEGPRLRRLEELGLVITNGGLSAAGPRLRLTRDGASLVEDLFELERKAAAP